MAETISTVTIMETRDMPSARRQRERGNVSDREGESGRSAARHPAAASCLLGATLFLLLLCSVCVCRGGRINALMIGMVYGDTLLEKYFDEEPLMEYTIVPCRVGGVGFAMKDLVRAVRLYFPRTYEDMQAYDYVMLLSPEFYILNPTQDLWMHDRIQEGAGGFNDASVFSMVAQIHNSWAQSLTQQAFPNDAPAVVARGGGGASPSEAYRVVINRDFPEPVLTPFVKYGVEDVLGFTSRYIIARDGAGVMAWQVENFPNQGRIPFLVEWDYGAGRSLTCGSIVATVTWFGNDNPYAADIITNLVLYSTQRGLIEDVDVFHRLKLGFREFNDRMNMLVAILDFVDRFGANLHGVQRELSELESMRTLAKEEYLGQDFSECWAILDTAFSRFADTEEMAKEAKEAALLWVYAVEWLATTAALLFSSAVLWSLMVRRKLYRQVRTTRFDS
jgi:hypothetical protein